MPSISINDAPSSVEATLKPLRAGLAATLPAKRRGNLLIGTWNVRAFGDLTEKWQSDSGDSPKRNLADICAIAEIVSRFDVVAVQETRDDLSALHRLMERLGSRWSFIVTDVGEGEPANGERLAYLFDTERVRLTGLAGELVVPEEWFGDIKHGALQRQFARTPYAVSFATGDQGFTLVTLHVIYGRKPADRVAELAAIAEWLSERASSDDEFNRNLIALGDFNIDRWNDPNWQALTNKGLTPPYELLDVPRTIFDKPKNHSFFDQIAWFTDGNREALTLGYFGKAGDFKWTDYLLQDLSNTAKSWRISDHYPLWAEFSLHPNG
jgi:endonuclease/exonuclease/phosphatase family metal-dependent hydrolase